MNAKEVVQNYENSEKNPRKTETEKDGDLWNQEIVGNSQLMLEMESRNSIYHEFWEHKILEIF